MQNSFQKTTKLFLYIYFLLLYLVFIFSRSFIGVYIFGYRIGEYLVAFSLLCALLSLIFYKYFSKFIDMKVIIVLFVMIFFFVASVIFRGESFFQTQIYRNSSFLWSISYIFVGIYISNYFKISKKFSNFLNINLLIAFYLQLVYFYRLTLEYGALGSDSTTYEVRLANTIGEPVLDFFILYSDKFETYKGTSFLLFFILITFISNNLNSRSTIGLGFFYLLSGLYIPVFLIRSRTAAFVAIIYVLFQIFKFKNFFDASVSKNLILLAIFGLSFFFSTSLLYEEKINIQNSGEVLEYLTLERNAPQGTRNFLELENGRLYSGDGNLNWRLQIWQDVFSDLYTSGQLLFGYGFNDNIPAMENTLPGYYGRTGLDGKNKNVHNFVVNMFARGGLTIVLLYCFLIFYLLKSDKANNNDLKLHYFLFPLLFASLFDASMENVHFPMFLYIFVGLHLSENIGYHKLK